jgi:hypothetical protein
MAVLFRDADGTVMRFPDGTTPEEIEEAIGQPSPVANPAEGMNAFQRGLVGAGSSAARAAEGVLDAAGNVIPAARTAADRMADTRGVYEQNRGHLGTAGTVGEVVGGIGSAAPLALAGPAVLPQMAWGALYGGLTTPGGPQERATGGLTESIGAGLGNLGTRLVGRFFNPSGPTPESVARLESRGVQPTFGQTVSAHGTGPGAYVGRLEEVAQSVPFGGGLIRDKRVNALQQFARATRENALPPGAAPEAAESVDRLRSAFNDAYEEVLSDPSMRVREIYNIEDGVLRAGEGVPVSPERLQTAQRTFEGIAKRHEYAQGMQPTLKQAHAVESDLEREASRLLRSMDADQQAMGRVLMNMADDFGQSWRAQAPPNVVADIREIDAAYRAYVPVRHAAKTNAVSRDPDEYTPNVFLRALRTTDRTPNKTEFIGGRRPLQQFARDAEDVLGSVVPDSGTPERAMGIGILAGAIPTGGATLIPSGMAAAYGWNPMQQYLTGRLIPGQRLLQRTISGGAGYGGAAGAGMAGLLD